MGIPAGKPATLEDLLAIPEERRFHELLAGELIEKAEPTGEHGDAQSGVVAAVRPAYHRKVGGPGGPGGWWILTEVEVLLSMPDGASHVARPDVVGFRRETCPERPTGSPVHARPDWVCEVLSASNANVDTVKKVRLYHQARVPHYWLADPRDATLTVLRWAEAGYVMVLRAERGEIARAEPFGAVELAVGTLFGDDT